MTSTKSTDWRDQIDTSIYWCCGRKGELEIMPPPPNGVRFAPSLRCPHCGKSGYATKPGSEDAILIEHTKETLRESGGVR